MYVQNKYQIHVKERCITIDNDEKKIFHHGIQIKLVCCSSPKPNFRFTLNVQNTFQRWMFKKTEHWVRLLLLAENIFFIGTFRAKKKILLLLTLK